MFSSLIFLFPSYPFDVKSIDDIYAPEKDMVHTMYPNAKIILIDIEQLDVNTIKLSENINTLDSGTTILYRGWMLTVEQYSNMEKHFSKVGINLFTSADKYKKSHYLPEWYSSLSNYTMKTLFAKTIQEIPQVMKDCNLVSAFIKDSVKSLTTSEGSIAKSSEQAIKIAEEILSTRGKIEGDTICIREVVKLVPETEERYFVFKGKAFGRTGHVPDIVQEISNIHDALFYSIDTVQLESGKEILIEVGDGQVSDIKKWSVSAFYKIFNE